MWPSLAELRVLWFSYLWSPIRNCLLSGKHIWGEAADPHFRGGSLLGLMLGRELESPCGHPRFSLGTGFCREPLGQKSQTFHKSQEG